MGYDPHASICSTEKCLFNQMTKYISVSQENHVKNKDNKAKISFSFMKFLSRIWDPDPKEDLDLDGDLDLPWDLDLKQKDPDPTYRIPKC